MCEHTDKIFHRNASNAFEVSMHTQKTKFGYIHNNNFDVSKALLVRFKVFDVMMNGKVEVCYKYYNSTIRPILIVEN